jgi:hypothetical protein
MQSFSRGGVLSVKEARPPLRVSVAVSISSGLVHDMAPFARGMGYVDASGEALPPIVWDEAERRRLRARLDALYFRLYGVTDEADVRYVLGTFPIVQRKDREAHGCYLTAELVVWRMRALSAGDADADAPVDTLIRAAKDRESRAA